jgi:hypothetical protein
MTAEQYFLRILADFRFRYLKKLGLNRGIALQKFGKENFSATFRYHQIQSIRASLNLLEKIDLAVNHYPNALN